MTYLRKLWKTFGPDYSSSFLYNFGKGGVIGVIVWLIIIGIYSCVFGADICIPLGDANNSGSISMSDAVMLINYIFAGGPAPDTICVDPDTSSMTLWWTMPGASSMKSYADRIVITQNSLFDSSIIHAIELQVDSTIQGGDTMRYTLPVMDDGRWERFEVWYIIDKLGFMERITDYGIERRRVTVVEKR